MWVTRVQVQFRAAPTWLDQTVQWRLQTTVTPKVMLLPPHLLVLTSTPSFLCASKTNAEPSDLNDLVNKSGESPDKSEPGWLEPRVDVMGQGEHTRSGKWSGVLELGLLCILKPELRFGPGVSRLPTTGLTWHTVCCHKACAVCSEGHAGKCSPGTGEC